MKPIKLLVDISGDFWGWQKPAGFGKGSLAKLWHRRFLSAFPPQERIISSPFLHPFLTASLSSEVRQRLSCPLPLERRCLFLRRWLSLLVSEGVRREARSPGTGSPLTAAGKTKTFPKTHSTAKEEIEGLWSVALPLGSSGKRWDHSKCLWAASNYGHESGMTWRRSGALSSVWLVGFSQDSAACLWPSHFVAQAPVADRSSSQLMPHHNRGVWRPHLTDGPEAGWWLQQPGHQPQLGIRDKPEVKAAEAGRNHLSCTCATERNNQNTDPEQ